MTHSLESALSRSTETADVDFKSSVDVSALRDWLELIKDIVAFANSGGGYVLVGLDDNGLPSNCCVDLLLSVDQADFGNKLFK
jgi:predicted HTH transcriptional regulator